MRHSEFLGALGSLGGHVAEGGGLLGVLVVRGGKADDADDSLCF